MKKSEISYQRFFQWSKQTNLELILILMTLLSYMTGKYSHLVIKAELEARSEALYLSYPHSLSIPFSLLIFAKVIRLLQIFEIDGYKRSYTFRTIPKKDTENTLQIQQKSLLATYGLRKNSNNLRKNNANWTVLSSKLRFASAIIRERKNVYIG